MRLTNPTTYCDVCGLPQASLPQQSRTCPGLSNPHHDDEQAGMVHSRVATMVTRNDLWFKHKPKRRR